MPCSGWKGAIVTDRSVGFFTVNVSDRQWLRRNHPRSSSLLQLFASELLKRLRGTDAGAIDLTKLKLRDQYDAGSLRAAANAPIQSSSTDIIKIAMVKLHDLIEPYQARLLLQVHDELVFEMPPDEWGELGPKIKATMESAVELSIPLVVEIHSGENWMETK